MAVWNLEAGKVSCSIGLWTGTERVVNGLQGFVSWKHPQVTVSEISATSSTPVYQVELLWVHGADMGISQLLWPALRDLRPILCRTDC